MRGAGSGSDSSIPGTEREKTYMRSKSMIKDLDDKTLDEVSNDLIRDVSMDEMSPSTALSRPQRSTRRYLD